MLVLRDRRCRVRRTHRPRRARASAVYVSSRSTTPGPGCSPAGP